MALFCSTCLGFKDIYTLEKDNFPDLRIANTRLSVKCLELISPVIISVSALFVVLILQVEMTVKIIVQKLLSLQ